MNKKQDKKTKIEEGRKDFKKLISEVNDLDYIELDKRIAGGWSIQELWNKHLTFAQEKREYEPREHIWSSELGMSHFDRWHKMKGIQPEKPYSERVLRKFAMGNDIERQVGFILSLSGLLKGDNEHLEVEFEDDEMLKVTGRYDFLAGGKVKNWSEIIKDPAVKLYFEFYPHKEQLVKDFHKVISKNGELKDIIYEIKSINSQVFWAKKDYLSEAYRHHQLQLFTYLKAKNLPEGRVLYLSKDDGTIIEKPVYLSDTELEKEWLEDIKKMSKLMKSETPPPIPELAVFDKRKKLSFAFNKQKYTIQGCWTDNWQIKWSGYILQMGFKDEDDYISKSKDIIAERNAELKEEYKNKNGLVKKPTVKKTK